MRASCHAGEAFLMLLDILLAAASIFFDCTGIFKP